MDGWVLIVGLATFFVGLTTVLLTAGVLGQERSQISSSLAAIEAISGPVPDEMRAHYDKSFKERVGLPAQAKLASIARTLSGANWARNTSRRLDMAGNPPNWDAERILATKTLTAISLGAIAGGLLFASGRTLQAVVWGIGFAVAGFFVPDLLLVNAAQRRSKQIERALPNSIDLLTISVEAGLAFDAAIAQVARNTRGPLAEELTRVLREIQIGSGRSEALRALAERTAVEDLRIFLNSLIQAEKLGIPIAEVLRVQAAEIRLKRSQRIEEQAMKLPVKIVFPLITCILPALFIVIIGPAAVNIWEQFLSR